MSWKFFLLSHFLWPLNAEDPVDSIGFQGVLEDENATKQMASSSPNPWWVWYKEKQTSTLLSQWGLKGWSGAWAGVACCAALLRCLRSQWHFVCLTWEFLTKYIKIFHSDYGFCKFLLVFLWFSFLDIAFLLSFYIIRRI